MGFPVQIDVCDPLIPEDAVSSAFGWLHEVNARFSTYREDSEVSRLNRGELAFEQLHPDLRHVLDRCEALRRKTDGFFDIRAPYLEAGLGPAAGLGGRESVDPSGFVKGWALAGAMKRLLDAGAENVCVNGGGDIAVRGRPAGDTCWRVGVQHPRIPDQLAFGVAMTGGAIATSGAYARGQHIINPHTGQPAGGLLSATIIGPDLAMADAYATSAFAMGIDRAALFCAVLSGYEAVLICDDDTVLSTPGVDQLRLNEEYC